ncbi:MAG TPA: DNA circularization N-terminal domain-containing protein [Caulobacteraceae bacterium]|jgi:prophage DNA circulation protein|nr:DNA circularization N-terminal domain-containing protein [Caulobacteraceae bacterium]
MSDTSTAGEIVVTAKPLQAVGLQKASFRGAPFGVTGDNPKFGRRLAVHEYPYRDVPWPEDLGRKARRLAITGFLIANSAVYGGGDVFHQLSAMIVAAETEGLGTLVHPYLGTLQVACDSFEPASELDVDGYLQISFSFVEGGNAVFPNNLQSTGSAVRSAATAAKSAVASSFSSLITPLLPLGGASITAIVAAVTAWTGQIVSLGGDATSLLNLGSELTGEYGRFFNGANAGLGGAPAIILPAGTTIEQLVQAQASDRAAISACAGIETGMAASLGLPGSEPTDLAGAGQACLGALAAVVANPADALRLLEQLATYASGGADAVTQAVDQLHQRLAVVALAEAAESYQPTSYNDAAAVRTRVCCLLDAQITIAGDTGDDASYAALIALRTAVIQDLTARGAALPSVATFALGASLPALAVAQRLYRDSTRSDQLAGEANPPNPLFMPSVLQVLAS